MIDDSVYERYAILVDKKLEGNITPAELEEMKEVEKTLDDGENEWYYNTIKFLRALDNDFKG